MTHLFDSVMDLNKSRNGSEGKCNSCPCCVFGGRIFKHFT